MTASVNLVMKWSEPTDIELVRGLLGGDKDAFAELYRRRHGSVYRFVLLMTGRPEMADDIVQETFMALLNHTAGYDERKGALNSFLIGVARNQVLNRFRQDRRMVLVDEHSEEIEKDKATREHFSSLLERERVDVVRKAILSLPPHYREVVILCELQEMSYAETALIMNCAVGTVRSRLHRARAILAEKLEPSRDESSKSKVIDASRCFA